MKQHFTSTIIIVFFIQLLLASCIGQQVIEPAKDCWNGETFKKFLIK